MTDFNKGIHENAVKKRLGQYFTNNKLCDFLVILANMSPKCRCIDPMAGSGNMLSSLLQQGQKKDNVYAIEIDQAAGELCKARIKQKNFILGDVFSPKTFSQLPNEGWDLVITNPPYIRYQSMKSSDIVGVNLPTAKQVRRNLIMLVDNFTHLEDRDKELFKLLINSYSGLSDIAVPAWILCAAMLKPEGKLVIVVPNTWLNREYSTVIQYMLLKWFDIEYIVEDGNGTWFGDALVRTEVIIAKRVKRKELFKDIENKKYLLIRLFVDLSEELSIIESVTQQGICKDDLLLHKRLIQLENAFCKIEYNNVIHLFYNFIREKEQFSWFQRIENTTIEPQTIKNNIPAMLGAILNVDKSRCKLITLDELGVNTGQGLRTGANKFFYLRMIEKLESAEILISDEQFNSLIMKIPKKHIFPVVQKQTDLPLTFEISAGEVVGRVLYIQDAVTQTDYDLMNTYSKDIYEILDEELEKYILMAQTIPIQAGAQIGKLIPNLSAVKPNDKTIQLDKKEVKRCWYMLPKLTERHVPDFFVARINNKSPLFYFCKDRNIVVDANFSTLWIKEPMREFKYAIFSILNSYWFRAYLEAVGTVMGGGALKVEAVHVKKIMIPEFTKSDYEKLNKYGKRVSRSQINNIEDMEEADQLILQYILGKSDIKRELGDLKRFVEASVQRRAKV